MIAIAGDSWGCGEWDLTNFQVLHTGLERYFRDDGYEIINTSKGFINNATALNRLESCIDGRYDIDKIVWFVTCPTRDLGISIASDPYEAATDALFSDLTHAESIAKKYQTKILAIGGLCDIPNKMCRLFPNVNVVIPSVCSLFISDYPKSLFGDPSVLKCIKNQKWIDRVNRDIGRKHDLFRASDWFPDDFHLGRKAYFEIYKIIKKYVDK